MAKAEEIQKRLDDTRKELRSLQTEEKKLLNEKAERLVKGKDPSKTTKKIRQVHDEIEDSKLLLTTLEEKLKEARKAEHREKQKATLDEAQKYADQQFEILKKVQKIRDQAGPLVEEYREATAQLNQKLAEYKRLTNDRQVFYHDFPWGPKSIPGPIGNLQLLAEGDFPELKKKPQLRLKPPPRKPPS